MITSVELTLGSEVCASHNLRLSATPFAIVGVLKGRQFTLSLLFVVVGSRGFAKVAGVVRERNRFGFTDRTDTCKRTGDLGREVGMHGVIVSFSTHGIGKI